MYGARSGASDPATRGAAAAVANGRRAPRRGGDAMTARPHQGGRHRRPDRPALVRRASRTPTSPGWSSATSTPGAACWAGSSSCSSRTARPTTPSPPPRRRSSSSRTSVDVLFGGIYSSTRQAIKGPAVVEGKTLYIYPEQYEGQESDPLIFCTGPVPAQQVDPFIPWLMRETGARTFYLPSADYIWPHVMNARVREVVTANGGAIVGEEYFPLDHMDYRGDRRADHRERRGRGVQHDRAARGDAVLRGAARRPGSRAAAGTSSARTSTRTS